MGTDPPDTPPTVETLWQQHHEFIEFWLRRFGVRDLDVPDVAADVIAAVIRFLPNFDPQRGAFRAWLYRIVERHAQKYGKRTFKAQRCSDAIHTCPAWRPTNASEESVINRLLVEELLQAIRPEKRRYVFVAYALQDWTIQEICEAFQIGANTARTWILRSRADFEAAFKRHQAELARIGAVLLPFTASMLLSRECDAALLESPGGAADCPEWDSEPMDGSEPPASSHSPGNLWSAVNPPAIDVGSLVAGLVGGAAIMFALMQLAPARSAEPIAPETSPMVVASSFVMEPNLREPISPLLLEPPGALPVRGEPPSSANAFPLDRVPPHAPTPRVAPTENARDESLMRGATGAYAVGDFDTARRLVETMQANFLTVCT
jgi:RNA polymerase sigma factor (sigma-70 family)